MFTSQKTVKLLEKKLKQLPTYKKLKPIEVCHFPHNTIKMVCLVKILYLKVFSFKFLTKLYHFGGLFKIS